MPAYFRLQDLKSVSASETQRIEDAVDISNLRTVIAQLRRVVACSATTGSATLKLQHAAVLEEDSFMDVSGISLDLTATGTTCHVAHDLMRYLRWVTEFSGTVTGSAQFMIDINGRET
jgi:hypothetical protein